ncbi:hypothetical protein CVT26_004357 [Gymnopilus dilepis]|uniref:Uncharacterized protein n=1 Tax=Gymnopilus dilepis TaxID=231916 RepID=A0A409W785_9AGAR|nr:hypothetical protein CVT26_004357 [Gymnopilus dilepis]
MPASKSLITSSPSTRSAPTSPRQVASLESQGGPSSRLGSFKGSSSNKPIKSSSATLVLDNPADAAEGSRPSILEQERLEKFQEFGRELPKAYLLGLEHGHWLTGEDAVKDVLRGCQRVDIVAVHGWFPGTMIRTLPSEPNGRSTKFANMTEQCVLRVHRGVDIWMSDLYEADVVFVSTHSQGSVVSTHSPDRLVTDGHIITTKNEHLRYTSSVPTGSEAEA